MIQESMKYIHLSHLCYKMKSALSCEHIYKWKACCRLVASNRGCTNIPVMYSTSCGLADKAFLQQLITESALHTTEAKKKLGEELEHTNVKVVKDEETNNVPMVLEAKHGRGLRWWFLWETKSELEI